MACAPWGISAVLWWSTIKVSKPFRLSLMSPVLASSEQSTSKRPHFFASCALMKGTWSLKSFSYWRISGRLKGPMFKRTNSFSIAFKIAAAASELEMQSPSGSLCPATKKKSWLSTKALKAAVSCCEMIFIKNYSSKSTDSTPSMESTLFSLAIPQMRSLWFVGTVSITFKNSPLFLTIVT